MKLCITGNVFSFGEGHAYGGERIIYYLIKELSKLGHEIYLFAREGCNIPKGIIKDYIPTPPLRNDLDVHFESVQNYIKKNNINFDIYMCNYFGEGWNPLILDMFPYAELTWCVWCHIGHQLKKIPFNTISYSNTLKNDFKVIGMPTIMIHYGIPKELYSLEEKKENYVVWIGKIEGGKNPDMAIKIAKASGIKIVIMAPPYNPGYFNKNVLPYIDNKNVFWVRGVDDEVKQKIMSKAKAFIYTNDFTWKEHFGIVMAESLAMGTPIIGMNRQNSPCSIVQDGIIQDGKTGFILNYEGTGRDDFIIDKGVELLKNINKISFMDCRNHFLQNFTSELMGLRYNYFFDKISGGSKFYELEVR
jgi:glycosyltransferase involved in cell wall biosynthesis